MTAAEILAEAGIQIRSSSPGRYYALCPKCSHGRKGAHRKLRCLGVTIDDKGVRWGCNHCPEMQGGKFYDDQRETRRMVGRPGHQRRDGGSFRMLYG